MFVNVSGFLRGVGEFSFLADSVDTACISAQFCGVRLPAANHPPERWRCIVRKALIRRWTVELLLCLGLVATCRAQENSPSLREQASSAYDAKNYKLCGKLYAELAGDNKTGMPAYDAACCFALSGDKDQAFQYLTTSLSLIQANAVRRRIVPFVEKLQADNDLVSLRADARWSPLLTSAQQSREKFFQSINKELYDMEEQDQADRSGEKFDREAVWPRDKQRIDRVMELVKAGALKAEEDFYNAALILQHGKEPAEFALSHLLLQEGMRVNPGDTWLPWLSAASEDRFLWSIGRPQIWGTQSHKIDGKWTLEPLDATAVNDERRKKMDVPTLAESLKMLERKK